MDDPTTPRPRLIRRIRGYVSVAASWCVCRASQLSVALRAWRLVGPALLLAFVGAFAALLAMQPSLAVYAAWAPLLWLAMAVVVLVPRFQALPLLSKPDGTREWAEIDNGARQTLLQIGGGLVLILGVVTAWLQYRDNTQIAVSTLKATNENLQLMRESQQREAFGRALDQLGSSSMSSRLAGIFALERISQDQPTTQWDVAEVITAFVRTQARRSDRMPPLPNLLPKTPRWPEEVDALQPAPDVQAALTVLGRNPWHPGFERIMVGRSDQIYRRNLDLRHTDLRGSDLAGFQAASLAPSPKPQPLGPPQRVVLIGADLRRAVLTRAHLPGAQLAGARLDQAWLGHAVLPGANLAGAVLVSAALRNAFLNDADLSKADLRNADLSEASLADVMFHDADLRGADLGADNLAGAHFERAQLAGAIFNSNILAARRVDEAYGLAEAMLVEGDKRISLAEALRAHQSRSK